MYMRETAHLDAVPVDATGKIFDFQFPHVRVDDVRKFERNVDFRDDDLVERVRLRLSSLPFFFIYREHSDDTLLDQRHKSFVCHVPSFEPICEIDKLFAMRHRGFPGQGVGDIVT